MKTAVVNDELYSALELEADRIGRSVEDLVNEAISAWLEDEAADTADHAKIEEAREEAARLGGVEFEAFFDQLHEGQS